MDKFGVFNLVNSLFQLYKNSQYSPQSDENPLFSVLKNLSSNEKPKKEENKPVVKAPLQSQMLNTARTHDEHVKRVLSKNP